MARNILTSAQAQAIVDAGGTVIYKNSFYSQGDTVPNDATILIDFPLWGSSLSDANAQAINHYQIYGSPSDGDSLVWDNTDKRFEWVPNTVAASSPGGITGDYQFNSSGSFTAGYIKQLSNNIEIRDAVNPSVYLFRNYTSSSNYGQRLNINQTGGNIFFDAESTGASAQASINLFFRSKNADFYFVNTGGSGVSLHINDGTIIKPTGTDFDIGGSTIGAMICTSAIKAGVGQANARYSSDSGSKGHLFYSDMLFVSLLGGFSSTGIFYIGGTDTGLSRTEATGLVPNDGSTGAGFFEFRPFGTAPTTNASASRLYAKTASSVTRLYTKDSDGNEYPLIARTSAELATQISNETGSGNLVFSLAPTLKNIVVNQNQNNDDMILAHRATDSSPTGTFINYKNAANNSSILKIDIEGSIRTAGTPLFIKSITGTSMLDYWGIDLIAGLFQIDAFNDYGIFYNALGNNRFSVWQTFIKSRSTDGITFATVQDGDELAHFDFLGDDGTTQQDGARFTVEVDGAPGAGSMPGRFVFSTTPSGANNSVERWIIKSSGHLLAATDNSWDIGASGATRPRAGYFATAIYAESNSGILGLGASRDVLLTRRAAANINFGAADAASPVSQTRSTQSVVGGTTNTSGATTTEVASLGTSQGVPGRFHIQTGGMMAASGTTQQTPVDRLVLGATKVLTNNSAIDILSLAIANNSSIGGIIHYSIEVFDGTDVQGETGFITYSSCNKAGTVSGTAVEVDSRQSVSAGTLTTTFAITNANPAVVSINANSSLTPSTGYPRITFSVENFTQQAITVQ